MSKYRINGRECTEYEDRRIDEQLARDHAHTTLTERLATAERMVESRSQELIHLVAERDAAIKERDVAKVVANDCDLKMFKALDERDAALAEANKWEARTKNAIQRETAALARAEAAEKAADADIAKLRIRCANYDELVTEYEGRIAELEGMAGEEDDLNRVMRLRAEKALADLRARIEALAEKWGHHEHGYELRALLTPRKAETALGAVDELITANSLTNGGDRHLAAELFKLRKLLEGGDK